MSMAMLGPDRGGPGVKTRAGASSDPRCGNVQVGSPTLAGGSDSRRLSAILVSVEGDVRDFIHFHVADLPLVDQAEQIFCRDPQSSSGLRRPEWLLVNHDRFPVRRSLV